MRVEKDIGNKARFRPRYIFTGPLLTANTFLAGPRGELVANGSRSWNPQADVDPSKIKECEEKLVV